MYEETGQMKLRTKIWSEAPWAIWCHNIPKFDRGSWGKYMMFHICSLTGDNRVEKTYNGDYMCVRCAHRAPGGAVALLEMMNWDNA